MRSAATRPPSLLADAGEHLEGDILDRVGDFGEFQRHAQVRLVGTEAAHGFGVGHAREGIGQIDVDALP